MEKNKRTFLSWLCYFRGSFPFMQRQKVESTNTTFWSNKKWAPEWFDLSEKWLLDIVVYALFKQSEHFSGLESDRVCKLWKECCAWYVY